MLSEYKPLQIITFWDIKSISFYVFFIIIITDLKRSHSFSWIFIWTFWSDWAWSEQFGLIFFFFFLTVFVDLKQLNIISLATCKPLLCPEYWAELQPLTVILTPTHFSSLPQPRRSPSQVSICRPSSFISKKIPFTFSIYFTDTFSSPFRSFFQLTPPSVPLLSLSL